MPLVICGASNNSGNKKGGGNLVKWLIEGNSMAQVPILWSHREPQHWGLFLVLLGCNNKNVKCVGAAAAPTKRQWDGSLLPSILTVKQNWRGGLGRERDKLRSLVLLVPAADSSAGVTQPQLQTLWHRCWTLHHRDRTGLSKLQQRSDILAENWVGSDRSCCKGSGERIRVKIDFSLKCPCNFNSSTGVLGLQMTAKFVPFCIIVFPTKKVSYIFQQGWYFP